MWGNVQGPSGCLPPHFLTPWPWDLAPGVCMQKAGQRLGEGCKADTPITTQEVAGVKIKGPTDTRPLAKHDPSAEEEAEERWNVMV